MSEERNQIVLDIIGKIMPIVGKEIEDKVTSMGWDSSGEFNVIVSIASSIVGTIINNFSNEVTKDLASVIISSTIMNQFHSAVIQANKRSNYIRWGNKTEAVN